MSLSRPRGPLPARVYWFRRLLVLTVVAGLVLGIGRLLGAGADGSSGPPTARQASSTTVTEQSGTPTPSAVSTADARPREAGSAGAGPAKESGRTKPAKKKTRTPLPTPTGPCQDSDVRVRPSPDDTYATDRIGLTLQLTTYQAAACTWQVSADSVVVRLTSGSDRIWSSQDCPAAIPTRSVVLRRKTPVKLDVVWSGRRSDSDCSGRTDWAEPGYYHLSSAAMGSEPESEQFRLMPPAPVTITPTPTPRGKGRGNDGSHGRGRSGAGSDG